MTRLTYAEPTLRPGKVAQGHRVGRALRDSQPAARSRETGSPEISKSHVKEWAGGVAKPASEE